MAGLGHWLHAVLKFRVSASLVVRLMGLWLAIASQKVIHGV